MTTIFRKRGDTAVAVEDILKLDTTAIDLSGSCVMWIWKNLDTSVITKHSASLDATTTGSVYYELQSSDVATTASYNTEWEVTFADSTVLSVPTDGYIRLRIVDDLG